MTKPVRSAIAVVGAFGHPNFGDQLLFNVLHSWLREMVVDVEVRVPWGNPYEIDWPPGVQVGGGWATLESSQALIFGGGGYFGESGRTASEDVEIARYTLVDRIGTALPLPQSLGGGYFGAGQSLRRETLQFLRYARIARFAERHAIPACITGTGLGPITTRLGRMAIGSILQSAKQVCLRDQESVNHARDLRRDKPIELGADLVLSMCQPLSAVMAHSRLGVHIDFLGRKGINLFGLAAALRQVRALGMQIVLLEDCLPYHRDQMHVAEEVATYLGSDTLIVPYSGVEALWATLKSVDAVLTTKLHMGIVAYVQGVLPLSVAAHPKTRRFYRQVGLEHYCFEYSATGVENACHALMRARQEPQRVGSELNSRREAVRQLADFERRSLATFLNEHCAPGS